MNYPAITLANRADSSGSIDLEGNQAQLLPSPRNWPDSPVTCCCYPFCMDQVKSRQRVIDHGEVFTPAWMVEAMLDLVKNESERIDSRFLEPACGSGNFLIQVLRRKLAAVETKYGKNDFEKKHHALLGLMCIYGIELLEDNTTECREKLLAIFVEYLKIEGESDWHKAAKHVLSLNIIQGDALSMTDPKGTALTFPEWSYLGKGSFQRRDFRYDNLVDVSSFGEGTLFAGMEKHEIFAPIKTFPQVSVADLTLELVSSRSARVPDQRGK